MKHLLTGNEAAARGAFEGGALVCSAYPGTPSTEIFENLPKYRDALYCEWAPNEKVAVEAAYGASIAGARSMSAMKHVGLNVAADPVFTAAYNGVGAGFVIVSADDPDCHSSQNEQDNRYYAKFAKLAMVEPSDSQECKDFMAEAFRLSEQFDLPVLYRMTTRVCHSKSLVEFGEREEKPVGPYKRNAEKFVSTPANAYRNHVLVEEKLKRLAQYAETSPLNRIEWGEKKIGVISASIAYQYAREVFPPTASFLKLGLTNPLPMALIRRFAEEVETLYVVEELEPFMEEQIRAAGIACIGKDKIPNVHELNPQRLREALFGEQAEAPALGVTAVPRPPALCAGCPHRGFFYVLSKQKNAVAAGDIGCYTLGCAPPLSALDSVVCMGGGFSVAHGMAKAFEKSGQDKKVFGVLGDSTFFHSGMTGAAEILYNKSRVIPVVLDNRITGMTGQQDNPGSGMTLMGEPAPEISVENVLRALGYGLVITVNPQNLDNVQKAIDDALASDVPAAIVTRRPCLLLKRAPREDRTPYRVIESVCRHCNRCLQAGCPALFKQDGLLSIDRTLCTGCSVCMQICKFGAIQKEED